MDFATGQCSKYKSARGAEGCCHVRENSEGLHMRLHIITSNFYRVDFCRTFRTGPIRAAKLTHTHTFHPCCGRPQLWTKKSKHSHSLKHTHTHTHTHSHACIFSNCRESLKLHVMSVTLTVICKCPLTGGMDCLCLF